MRSRRCWLWQFFLGHRRNGAGLQTEITDLEALEVKIQLRVNPTVKYQDGRDIRHRSMDNEALGPEWSGMEP